MHWGGKMLPLWAALSPGLGCKGESELGTAVHSSLRLDHGSDVTSCLNLLPLWLPDHNGRDPQTVSQKKPCPHRSLLSVYVLTATEKELRQQTGVCLAHELQSQKPRDPGLVRTFFLLHTMEGRGQDYRGKARDWVHSLKPSYRALNHLQG